MFTRNYYVTLPRKITEQDVPKAKCFVKSIGGKDFTTLTTGYSKTMHYDNFKSLLNYLFNTAMFKDRTDDKGGGIGVLYGTGNTAPTINDITLSGEPVDSSKITQLPSITENYTENYYECSALYTITNTGDTEITIGEIALVNRFSKRDSQYGADELYPYILERTALETPITIPAGGVGQVTYTIRMEYPVPPIEE